MLNGTINVYKEPGFTSHDVVAKMRGITGQKKIGHTGTLDPDAEGVLVLCLGKATKQCERIAGADKTYEAVLLLGVTTDTQDISGRILAEHAVDVEEAELREVLAGFLGEQMQIPPMYSAKKIKGKKLYELARQGVEVERPPRPVHFYAIELLSYEKPRARIRVTCSKGTYIRTLCHDIGEKLGCGGCMEHLLRTRVGSFTVEDAHRLAAIQAAADAGSWEGILCPAGVPEGEGSSPSVVTRKEPASRPVISIGKFDGLHRGHQKLIRRVKELSAACGAEPAVFSFVFGDGRSVLLTAEERKLLLDSWGIARRVEVPFSDAIRQMSPEEFVRRILVDELHIGAAVVGTDFRFGQDRLGTAETLCELGDAYGFPVEVLSKERDGDRDISSTYVREELAAGHMEKVNDLLGYHYSVRGEVVHGRHLGSSLGFPTINQIPDERKALPPNGVYRSRVSVGGATYRGLTNIGTKPTVSGERVGLETYLYDCEATLYGQMAVVELLEFRRPEQKFASVEELREQVRKDIAAS